MVSILEINEARKNLEACLGEDLKKEYFALLRQWFLFSSPITKEEFDRSVRRLFVNEKQIRCHNYFLLAMLAKTTANSRAKSIRSTNEKVLFESVNFSEYVPPSSPTTVPPSEFKYRSAAEELFIPDSGFISSKIAIKAWENGLDGADNDVTDLIVHACHVYVKNIITAMISRKKGYKIRDRKFQYGFNQPIPDPFIRNYNNIVDETQESKVEVADDDDCFKPKCKMSVEHAEQNLAFAYSCSKRRKCDNTLTTRLLYDTIRENPKILGFHSIQSISLFKLSLQLDDDTDFNDFGYES